MGNPFKAIAEMYEEQVNKANESGLATYYKLAFDHFKDNLLTNEYASKEDVKEFHVCDVEYLDGYFIFGSGTNSVVHFHVKECPDWKFAIWWNEDTEYNKYDESGAKKRLQGEFFCQYEPTIDKFKPTRSSYNTMLHVPYTSTEDLEVTIPYDLYKKLSFISRFPALAWGHDYCGYDYSTSYHPYYKVKLEFLKYKFNAKKDTVVKKLLDKYAVNFAVKLFKPTIQTYIDNDGWEMEVEYRDYCSPSHEIVIKLPEFEVDQETGCFAFFEDTEEGKRLTKKFHKRLEFLAKISRIFGTYWHRPIDDCVVFWKESEQVDDDESDD